MGAEESLFFPELVRLDWSTAQSETSTDLPVQHIAILSAPGRLIQFFPGAQLKTIWGTYLKSPSSCGEFRGATRATLYSASFLAFLAFSHLGATHLFRLFKLRSQDRNHPPFEEITRIGLGGFQSGPALVFARNWGSEPANERSLICVCMYVSFWVSLPLIYIKQVRMFWTKDLRKMWKHQNPQFVQQVAACTAVRKA